MSNNYKTCKQLTEDLETMERRAAGCHRYDAGTDCDPYNIRVTELITKYNANECYKRYSKWDQRE